ncbi:MAG TPA: O-antigen ligase family protein [Verrucomicrobiae bacterium]
MDAKDLIGLTIATLATALGTVLCSLSQRIRELAFFFLIAGTVVTDRIDINFVSHYWYRGTTRGFEFSLLDVLAISLLLGQLFHLFSTRGRIFWPASLAFMLLYVSFAGISILFADPKIYGLFELSKMLRCIVVFTATALFVRSERELMILVFALCCIMGLECLLSIKQRYLNGVYRATGTLEHPNSLSMYVCMVTPLLVAAYTSNITKYLRWMCFAAIGCACLSILLTLSRAGIPIFAMIMLGTMALCGSWKITIQKIAIGVAALMVVSFITYKSWDSLQARFGEASFHDEYLDTEKEGRGVYLRIAWTILQDKPFGVGLNNWSYWVSKTYGEQVGLWYEDYDDLEYQPDKVNLPSFHYAAPAHNLMALTAGELGFIGLGLFLLLWARWFWMGQVFIWRRAQTTIHRFGVGLFFGVMGVFLQSVTEWTYRQTAIAFAFHIFLGTLASLYYWRKHTTPAPTRRVAVRQAPREEEYELVTAGERE